MTDQVKASAFHATDGLEDWRIVAEGACAFFPTATIAESARFIQAVAALPGIEDHAPAIDLRRDGVTVRTISMSEDYMGMTDRDVDVARQVSGMAREMGLVADTTAIQSLLIFPAWTDIGAITPFWRAALGYEPRPDSPVEDLVDPHDRGPGFWFETMDETRGDGGGNIHLGVWVPPEHAEARVAAALGAGGHVVRDIEAPSWWTLADAAGNEVDIATVRGRD
jgi:4a-hydroxytetrahydrobiopterin dehydratase